MTAAKSRYGDALQAGTLAASYVKHLEDENYKSLRDEIALMRSFTEAMALALRGTDLAALTPTMCGAVMTMVGEVRALVEAMARVDQKISLSLTVPDVYVIVMQVFDVIKKHVRDPDQLRDIAHELQDLQMPAASQEPGEQAATSLEQGDGEVPPGAAAEE